MATGKCKWYNATKGYGFIVPDDGGGDVFVHVTAITNARIGEITEGDRLNYELVTEKGKISAGSLSRAD